MLSACRTLFLYRFGEILKIFLCTSWRHVFRGHSRFLQVCYIKVRHVQSGWNYISSVLANMHNRVQIGRL